MNVVRKEIFESKYSRYVNDNTTRFAEENEIIEKLVSAEKGSGIPLYAKKKTVYVDNMDNHSMIIGGTGCGKSRAVCKTLIKSIITNKESAVINDPKGELYRTTANSAKQTHNIKVLNLRSPELSEATTSGLNAVLDLCADKTKSCIYGVIHTGLDGLIKSESVLNLFNSNEIDFYDLAKKQHLFILSTQTKNRV